MRARVLAIVAAIAAVSAYVALHEADFALTSGGGLALELGAGLLLAGAGVTVMAAGPDRLSGALLCAAAAVWLMAEWESPGAPGAQLFTLGLVTANAAPALLAHALLVHGRGRLGARATGAASDRGWTGAVANRAVVGAAYGGLVVLAGVAATVVDDPRARGCTGCPANLIGIANDPDAMAWLERWGLRIGAAALAATVLLALWRLWRAGPALRRTTAPVIVPGLAVLGVTVAQIAHDLGRSWHGYDSVDERLRLIGAGMLIAVVAGVAWQRLAARRMRGRLARLVVEMAEGPRPGGLRDLVAAALGDPALELLYPFEGGWIGADGTARQPAGPVTTLLQDGAVAAGVTHRPGLLDDPRLVDELGKAARLAIDHERLQAHQRAQLDRLRVMRAAIVAAGDGERRRLERDLHDGAQQALAGLAMAIGLERGTRTDAHAGALARAQDAVRAALDDVRALAHAMYPPALDEAGLAAALDVLGDWRPQVELGALPSRRVDPALEAGVYFIVAALTRAESGNAVVDIHSGPDSVTVDVRTAAAADLAEVEDRVGALGGRLVVAGDRRHVRVEFACA